jgi:hypothetical protein
MRSGLGLHHTHVYGAGPFLLLDFARVLRKVQRI